jgi:hypothetical protein
MSAAVKFLADMFRRSSAPVFVTSLANDKSQSHRLPPQQIITRQGNLVDRFIAKWDQPERAIYFCVATLQPGATRRCKENLAELICLHVDLDYKNILAESHRHFLGKTDVNMARRHPGANGKRRGRATLTFYHYTQEWRMGSIWEEGLRPIDEAKRNYFFILGDCAPDNVVWLTTQRIDPISGDGTRDGDGVIVADTRITLALSPKDRRLYHWASWLRKHMPAVFAAIASGEIPDRPTWRDFWFYRGRISPSRFKAVEWNEDD